MNVGLVAHDGKKNLMQNLCIAYQDILKKHKLYATSTTGQMIEDVANLKIHKLLAARFTRRMAVTWSDTSKNL